MVKLFAVVLWGLASAGRWMMALLGAGFAGVIGAVSLSVSLWPSGSLRPPF